MNAHTAKLVQATAEIIRWETDPNSDSDVNNQLELLGHDVYAYTKLADAASRGFADMIIKSPLLSDLDKIQKAAVYALVSTTWEMGAAAAEIAYGQRVEPSVGDKGAGP